MWFGNLSTSTELQGFHYYQGKIQSAATVFHTPSRWQQQPQNSNHQKMVSISYTQDSQWATKWAKKRFIYLAWACWPKPLLHGLNLSKSPIKNHATLFRSGRVVNWIKHKLGSTKPNKSPYWRLVQSPTSTAILQKQSLIPTTHPSILKLEDQLKLHTASTSQ